MSMPDQLLIAFSALGMITFIGVALILGLVRKKLDESETPRSQPAEHAAKR